MEILSTPLGSMFTGVTTSYQLCSRLGAYFSLLEHGKITLALYSTVIIYEAMRILHGPPTPLVLIFTHTNSEGWVVIRDGFPSGWMAVERLYVSLDPAK